MVLPGGDIYEAIFRPPDVLRQGREKTVFVNFMDACER